MAEQFSLPQEQVLEELNGEGLGWVLPWGPLIPSFTPLRRWGSGPAGRRGTHSTAEHPERPRGGGRRVGGPGAALQTALCSPGVGSSIGKAMHSQLKSTVYEALASVLSLGQGECLWGPGPTFLLPPQWGPPLPFWTLCPHLAVPWGRFRYNYRDRGPPGPLGCSDFPQGL